jgi:hypothetical protein
MSRGPEKAIRGPIRWMIATAKPPKNKQKQALTI